MLHLFTPVGISVFLNLIRWMKSIKDPELVKSERALKSCLNNVATVKEMKLLTQITKDRIFENQNYTSNFTIDDKIIQQASAEIQSIHQILLHPKWQGIKFRLHLLTTDSQTSPLAGEIIAAYFKENSRIETVIVKKIDQLQINQSDQFRDNGIQSLINYIHFEKNKTIRLNNKNQRLEGLLNITSGYKGITPILTIIGQLLNIPLVYLYERSDNLIEIPPLPLSFNWTQLELFQYCFAKIIVDQSATQNDSVSPESSSDLLNDTGLRKFFYKEMIQNGLVREIQPGNTFEITFLGRLLRHHIEQVYPSGTKAFGIAFEFLFYESFINEPLIWESYSFDWVIHHKQMAKREFDLEFRLKRNESNPLVVGEICSYGQLADFKKNKKYAFLKQIKKQVKGFSSGTYRPWGYTLLIYSYEGMSDWKLLRATIEDIENKLALGGVQRFRVFGVKLPIVIKSSGTRNPYSDLYQRKLTRDKQQWRQGNRAKYGNPWLWLEESPHLN